MVKKNENNKKATPVAVPPSPHETAQTFGGVGLLEAVDGMLLLRGRHGQRDHIYPMHRAVEWYYTTMDQVAAMARTGTRGWDTLMDIANDMKAKILEAVEQCASLNEKPCQAALDFYAKFHHVK